MSPSTKRRSLAACTLIVLSALGACGQGNPGKPVVEIRVLAAASLSGVIRELAPAFEQASPGVQVVPSFAGSNQLRTQLEQGAPGDVFISADRAQMEMAERSGVVAPSAVRAFASNSLVIIVPKTNPAHVSGVADLARPGLKLVVADPAVPLGSYTQRMLDRAGASELGPAFARSFEANVVSREQNAAAVVAKVSLAEADAGISYARDGAAASGVLVIPLPESVRERAEYYIAVPVHARSPGLGAQFVEFCGSDAGAELLSRHGLIPPGAP